MRDPKDAASPFSRAFTASRTLAFSVMTCRARLPQTDEAWPACCSRLRSASLKLFKPGFNAALLQNPALGWFKISFQDAWDTLRKSDTIQVTTIPDARARLLDDQPALTDAAITGFLERVAPAQGRP